MKLPAEKQSNAWVGIRYAGALIEAAEGGVARDVSLTFRLAKLIDR